jgi:membrane dipeptidase
VQPGYHERLVQPVIFSHANPYTLVPHGRNVTDEQIRACAATGGVVCVSGLSFFLGSAQPPPTTWRATQPMWPTWWACARRHRSGHLLHRARPGRHATGRLRPIALVACLRRLRMEQPPTFTPPEVWRELPLALRRVGMSDSEAELVLAAI